MKRAALHVLVGVLVAACHALSVAGLLFYTGLGMDPEGHAFTKEVVAQPGAVIGASIEDPFTAHFVMWWANAIFWFAVGVGASVLVRRARQR